MYIKNSDFYFSKNDYLHFDKLKFTVYGYDTRRIIDRKHYDYAMDTISLHADYGVHIDFCPTSKSSDEIKVSITKDKYRNKMSLLYNLKYIVSSIYNAIYLCKQYVYVFEFTDTLYISIMSENKIRGNSVNLIKLHEKSMDLHIDTNNPIEQNNTITVITRPDINNLLFDKIIIENNIVRAKHMLIIYHESYNIYYEGMKSDSISFGHYNDYYYIRKLNGTYYINYHTAPPLLVKFIDNIKLFDNIDKVCINNEYDMLKYI